MITEAEYKAYFGVSTAPDNLTRLEFISLEEIKSIMTCDVPNEEDDNYDTFLKALMEQINYFNLNDDMLVYATSGGASLGKFKEETSSESTNANSSIISPLTYKILLNLGYIYVGLC